MANIGITSTDLGIAIGVTNTVELQRYLDLAGELFDAYGAGSAPQSIQDEATIRLAGWLARSPAHNLRSQNVGDLSISFGTNQAALRHSGAMSLLSRFVQRQVGHV